MYCMSDKKGIVVQKTSGRGTGVPVVKKVFVRPSENRDEYCHWNFTAFCIAWGSG